MATRALRRATHLRGAVMNNSAASTAGVNSLIWSSGPSGKSNPFFDAAQIDFFPIMCLF